MSTFKLYTPQRSFTFEGTIDQLISQDYYDDLIKLDCRNGFIKKIKKFPRNAITIDLTGNNYLEYLPPLPQNLVNLYVSNCNLKKLPILSNKIQRLYCGNNSITELPENLPKNIRELSLENNKISKLPDISNNTSLKKFDISNNCIENISFLPDNLIYFDCSFNKINSILNIPKNLTILNIENNLFKELPLLCENLTIIFLDNNLFSYDIELILKEYNYKVYNFYILNRKRKSKL